MNVIRFAVAAAAVMLAGCASPPMPPPGYPANQAVVAPKLDFVIPPPAALGVDVDLVQTIVARYAGRSYTFDAQIQITANELDFVAIDGFGRRALTVTWNGDVPHYEPAPWLPAILRPADILADFVICYWPDNVVAAAIQKAGAHVVNNGTVRKIVRDGRELIVVEYGAGKGWNRSAKLRNLAFGYEIDVESAENR